MGKVSEPHVKNSKTSHNAHARGVKIAKVEKKIKVVNEKEDSNGMPAKDQPAEGARDIGGGAAY